jgi:acetolactate synthase-1/2/3 large subunit
MQKNVKTINAGSKSNASEVSVAQRIAAAFKRHGVRYLFGQSNPPGVTLACARLGIDQIGYRQENSGTYMADAFARVSKTIPVVTCQNGPAATLLVPGLAECLSASIPIVVLAQDIARINRDRNGFQELDQVALFQGVAKWIKRVPCEERLEDFIDMAFAAAGSGRPGPAVLLCPQDLLNTKSTRQNDQRTTSLGYYPLDRMCADPARINQAAKWLCEAKAPVVYAGGGVIGSGAEQELRALQEKTHLPVATSTMGKGAVDEAHSLSIGVIGYYMAERGMTKFAKPLIQDADVILLIGNRTNQNGTDNWSLLPRDARYIHLDIDPIEIGRNYEALRLLGDAKATLPMLVTSMQQHGISTREAARPAIEQFIKHSKTLHQEEIRDVVNRDTAPLRPERIMAELEKVLKQTSILVADASFSSIWVANFLHADGSRKFITPRGQAGLGWGFPMAMGAKLAAPERDVFCVVGDGGFAHVWSELETAKRLGIKVIVFVMNNAILGYQMHAEDASIGTHTNVCEFSPVDHAAIAQACGCTGITLERADRLSDAIEQALSSETTVVIDCLIDPNAMPPVTIFTQLECY